MIMLTVLTAAGVAIGQGARPVAASLDLTGLLPAPAPAFLARQAADAACLIGPGVRLGGGQR